jgi:hypothetical protein
VLQGIVPAILGVNITGSVFLGILGVVADSLNHLIFTMPFLPSEGEETKLLINDQMKDVLVFHYLPILWYRYPIPNDIREFWYNERRDILNYMQKAYKDLDIQFLPDNIVHEFNQQKLKAELPQLYDSLIVKNTHHISDYLSTEILSKNHLTPVNEFLPHLNFINEHFKNFLMTQVDKLL